MTLILMKKCGFGDGSSSERTFMLALHAIRGRGFNSPAVFSFVIKTPCQLYDELKSCIYTINIVFKYSRYSANCLPKERSIQNVDPRGVSPQPFTW